MVGAAPLDPALVSTNTLGMAFQAGFSFCPIFVSVLWAISFKKTARYHFRNATKAPEGAFVAQM